MEHTPRAQAHTLPPDTPFGRVIFDIQRHDIHLTNDTLPRNNLTPWIEPHTSPTRANLRRNMQRISEQSVAGVPRSPPTFISLANTTLHLTCMGEQELRTLCMIQQQVTCFKLSLDLIQTPQASYRTILIPQPQTLLILPSLVWRSRIASSHDSPLQPNPNEDSHLELQGSEKSLLSQKLC